LAPRFYMTREEFFEWLDACPTSWHLIQDNYDNVWVSFIDIKEYDDDEE